jgi:hypothetical protein
MMKGSWSLLLACLISVGAHAGCQSPPPADAKYSSRTLTLSPREPARAFYFRAQQYAIVVERQALIRLLEERFKQGHNGKDGRLLSELRTAVESPGRYADLFAFVLLDPFSLERIQLLLGAMLETGEATVVHALSFPEDKGRILPHVVLYSVSASGAYSARRFCAPSGELLLEIVDSVA